MGIQHWRSLVTRERPPFRNAGFSIGQRGRNDRGDTVALPELRSAGL